MKKYIMIPVVLVATIGLLAGCGSSTSGQTVEKGDTSSSTTEAPAEESAVPTIGDTITSKDGLSVTANAVDYAAVSPNQFAITDAKGVLVSVSFTLKNDTKEALKITSGSSTAYIGDIKYESSAIFSAAGDWYVMEELNPGLGVDVVAYFDMPADTKLTGVSFATDWIMGEDLLFAIN